MTSWAKSIARIVGLAQRRKNALRRPARITAIVALMVSMSVGSSTIAQPGRTSSVAQRVAEAMRELGDSNPRVREKAAVEPLKKALGGAPATRAFAQRALRSLGKPVPAAATRPAGPLYNGIVLPRVWPPRRKELRREPMSPPYLKNPPKVIPIDVGRQLLVDGFLIEQSDLKRTFHRPEYHKINPIIKADQPWETCGKSYFVAPFQGCVLYDPRDRLFKMWYLHSTKGDYYCDSVGYAISEDGIHWKKPVFAESRKPDENTVSPKKGTNLIIQGRRTCCNAVVLNHNAKSPDERFMMFASDWINRKWHCVYRTSPDGIHWSKPLAQRTVWGDYVLAFYNPFRRMWVYEARIHGGEVGRCRAYMEDPDPRKLAERVPYGSLRPQPKC